MRTSCLVLALATSSAFAVAGHADETVHLSKCGAVTETELHDMALQALTKRKYKIESDTPTSLVGQQDEYHVEIAISAQTVEIRWQGKPGKHEYWIHNLKTDLLWSLSE
jgi:hypothetical protein